MKEEANTTKGDILLDIEGLSDNTLDEVSRWVVKLIYRKDHIKTAGITFLLA